MKGWTPDKQNNCNNIQHSVPGGALRSGMWFPLTQIVNVTPCARGLWTVVGCRRQELIYQAGTQPTPSIHSYFIQTLGVFLAAFAETFKHNSLMGHGLFLMLGLLYVRPLRRETRRVVY